MPALIETQLLVQIGQFEPSHVFSWLQIMYKVIYIHIEVYQELTDSQLKRQVTRLIEQGAWVLFSPARLNSAEQAIYQAHVVMLTQAWLAENDQRLQRGQPISLLTQPSTLATVAASLTWNIPTVCSDNTELTQLIAQHRLQVTDGQRPSRRIEVVNALQLSRKLAQRHLITPKIAHQFYQHTILEQPLPPQVDTQL